MMLSVLWINNMCISPIKIDSRSLVLSSGTPLRMSVPCGHCSDCQRVLKSDWFVRSYFEYLKTKNDGGFTYFETLTYNDQSLPRYNGLPCFSKHHIRIFFQRLKKSLNKLGYKFGKDSQNYVRYLVTCEYGGKNHRPHYHCLLFVNCPCLSLSDFKRLVNEAWQHGFCNPLYGWRSLPSGARVPINLYTWLVTGPEFLRYVVKYIVKDYGFEKDYKDISAAYSFNNSSDFNVWIPDCFADLYGDCRANLTFDRYDKYLNDDLILTNSKSLDSHDSIYKEIAPFHLSSLHYGFSLIENLSEEEINSKSFVLQTGVDGIDQRCSIPKYLLRKMLMDYRRVLRDDGKYYVEWYYNDFGIKHKLLSFDKDVSKLAKNYSDFPANASQLYGRVLKSGLYQEATQIKGIIDRLDQLIPCIEYTDVAAYSLFYRYTYTPYWFSHIPDLNQQVLTRFDKSALPCEFLDYTRSPKDRLKPFLSNMLVGREGSYFYQCELFMNLYDQFKLLVNSNITLSDFYKVLVKHSLQNAYS